MLGAYLDLKAGPEISVHRHGAGVIPANGKGNWFLFEFPRSLVDRFGSGRVVAQGYRSSVIIRPESAAALSVSMPPPTML